MDVLKVQLEASNTAYKALKTSHAFHSGMMTPILDTFADKVREANPKQPQIPFLSNLTGTWILDEEAVDPKYWSQHLANAVLFEEI